MTQCLLQIVPEGYSKGVEDEAVTQYDLLLGSAIQLVMLAHHTGVRAPEKKRFAMPHHYYL